MPRETLKHQAYNIIKEKIINCEYAPEMVINEELIQKEISVPEHVTAPVKKGDKIGEAVYRMGSEKIGSVDIIASEDIPKAGFSDYIKEIFLRYFS